MKTFIDYLRELIYIIAFGLTLAWLCSCNSRAEKIHLIHQYQDSVGITNLRITLIDMRSDSIRDAYSDAYPAKAFPLTREGERARAAYARDEHNAYMQYLKLQAAHDAHYDPIKTQYLEDLNRYKRIVDSLKLTLQ